MITFRQHIVTLVAVFLALAVGVVLGGGPLTEVGRGSEEKLTEVKDANADLKKEAAAAQAAAKFEDSVAGELGPKAFANGLDTRSVAIVSLPGADPKVVKSLTGLVGKAGGDVTGNYALEPDLLNPNQKSLVETLGSQLMTSLKDPDIDESATTYDRIGRIIGRGISTVPVSEQEIDEQASSVTESLKGADLMTTTNATKRALLVLVVLGEEPDADSGTDRIVRDLLTGLQTRTAGTVVAGSTASADGGLLSTLRDDEAMYSTSDSVQTGAGRLAAVLALIAEMGGKTGHYGASGSDGTLPVG